MTSESPVFLTKVECPICKTINEFETIKVGAYTEAERDTDFCPTERTWRNQRYQAYNPLLFFTATCANCFYSREFNNNFKEWKDDAYFKTYRLKTVKENHLELLADADSIIKSIGGAMDPGQYPNETAVLKLILAIIDESFYEKSMDLDLARFYLRIGWLFREMDRSENTTVQVSRGHFLEIEHVFSDLKNALKDVDDKLSQTERVINSRFEDDSVSAEMKSLLFQTKDKYGVEIFSFKEMLSLLDGKVDSLGMVIKEHHHLVLGTNGADSQPSFLNYPSFYDFLSELSERWDTIPRSEKEALTFSVRHYVKAFEDGRDIAAGNQQIQALYLIAELSRRIGEHDQAKEYFNKTIRTGQEFIHKYKSDKSRTALAKKILELAIEQGRENMTALKTG